MKDWGITKAVGSLKVPKYVLHQSNIYPFEKTLYGEYTNLWSRKDFADHSEFYKTKTGYAVIISPCSDMYEDYKDISEHVEKKNDIVRKLEIKLDIKVELKNDNTCRFCTKKYSQKCSLGRHLKTCKKKQEYQAKLENI